MEEEEVKICSNWYECMERFNKSRLYVISEEDRISLVALAAMLRMFCEFGCPHYKPD